MNSQRNMELGTHDVTPQHGWLWAASSAIVVFTIAWIVAHQSSPRSSNPQSVEVGGSAMSLNSSTHYEELLEPKRTAVLARAIHDRMEKHQESLENATDEVASRLVGPLADIRKKRVIFVTRDTKAWLGFEETLSNDANRFVMVSLQSTLSREKLNSAILVEYSAATKTGDFTYAALRKLAPWIDDDDTRFEWGQNELIEKPGDPNVPNEAVRQVNGSGNN